MSPYLYSSFGSQKTYRDHAASLLRTLDTIKSAVDGDSKITINGDNLDTGQLVAVACHGTKAVLDTSRDTLERIQASIDVLERCLAEGQVIYGVNTGFGGSADVRTTKHYALQLSLPKFLNSGVLLPSDKGLRSQNHARSDMKSHSLPREVVRATMLIRCNSLMRGHSGVRLAVIDAMMGLLAHDWTPVVPLRGSISASGDLAPLSYIVRALQGCPDSLLECGSTGAILSADKALKLVNIAPVILGPKEGLGLLNGTATSAAYASLALHQSQQLALLTQVLTAMGTEALLGHASNFDPFIAEIRPHSGQREAASNILEFLSDSRLCTGSDEHVVGLAQDRYALRTASQWIGPQLEDLMLAETQLSTELNSTTDNPLIDASTGIIHHGGNFQAASVTSAMEKTRLAVQMLGKLIFAQSQELVDPALNKGLPPNLTAEEPSLCFTFKGADIAMAAYMSELAFLANPVSTHVHSAEMHNQAVNSLALVSARYTMDAVEVLSMMCATYLTELCQALDLRVRAAETFKLVRPAFNALTEQLLTTAGVATPTDAKTLSPTIETLWAHLRTEWDRHSNSDLHDRALKTSNASRAALLDILDNIDPSVSSSSPQPPPLLPLTATYRTSLTTLLRTSHLTIEADFNTHGAPTKEYLGRASRVMYTHVRDTLGVPLQKDLEGPGFESVEAKPVGKPQPTVEDGVDFDEEEATGNVERNGEEEQEQNEKEKTEAKSKYWGSSVGTKVSAVYDDLRSGGVAKVMATCFDG